MLKRVLILSSLLMLLALSASAGVDQIILGGDEADGEDLGTGEMPLPDSDFYKPNHDQATDQGPGDGPLDTGGLPVDPQGDPYDDAAPVPEPATGLMLGMGVLGLAKLIRRKAS